MPDGKSENSWFKKISFFDRDLKNDEFERMNWRHTYMRNVFDTILTPFLWPKTTAKSFKMPLLTTYYSTLQSTANSLSTLQSLAIWFTTRQLRHKSSVEILMTRNKKKSGKKPSRLMRGHVEWQAEIGDQETIWWGFKISRHYASDNQAQNHKHTHTTIIIYSYLKSFSDPPPA